MSVYGIPFNAYGSSSSFWDDVSGFTITINPLAMTQTNIYHGATWLGSPEDIDNTPGGGNTFSLIANNIDAYESYIQNDGTVTDQYEILAASPVFWVLNISEVRNPRLQTLLDSNNSGWGHDVRFYLRGMSGRNDINLNTNNSRTSDALFTHILDPYFHTDGASPFTSGKLVYQGGVGGLGSVWAVFARALNPYAFLNDGAGTQVPSDELTGSL